MCLCAFVRVHCTCVYVCVCFLCMFALFLMYVSQCLNAMLHVIDCDNIAKDNNDIDLRCSYYL